MNPNNPNNPNNLNNPDNADNKEILNKILETTEDNNKFLKKISRGILFSRIMTFVYWIVILGVGVGAYYYIQPYIDGLFDTYDGVRGGLQGVSDFINFNIKR